MVHKLKYLGSILYQHGSMESEMRERAVDGRKLINYLGHVIKEKKVNTEMIKRV